MQAARLTIFAGHYGSGKTTLAVNYARRLREGAERVFLCDLDIVNPYFRTADARELLSEGGVELIASRFAGTNVDAPALPPETMMVFDTPDAFSVIDLGGDDRGALALGRYAGRIALLPSYEMWLVFNPYRPLTRTAGDLEQVRGEMEGAAKVAFTGLVCNANLGEETTLEAVADRLPEVREAARALDLPLVMIAVDHKVLEAGRKSAAYRAIAEAGEIFPVTRFGKSIWKI